MQDSEGVSSESKDTVLEEAYIDEYWSAYRQHVHTLLAWGYADSRHRVQADDEEPAITGFIAEAIENRLNDPLSPGWCDTISIHDDPPIPGGGRTGRGRWRPDLIFKSMERRPRLLYHFEAKRLRAQGGPARHLHYEQDEWFYVLEGEFQFEVGTQRFRLQAGEALLAPRRIPHVWAFVGEGRGRILIAFLPAGKMEAFFRAVTRANAMPPQDPELWRTHGMELLGPPLPVA